MLDGNRVKSSKAHARVLASKSVTLPDIILPRNGELYKYAISFLVFLKVIGFIFIHTSCFEGISSYSCILDGNSAYIVTARVYDHQAT